MVDYFVNIEHFEPEIAKQFVEKEVKKIESKVKKVKDMYLDKTVSDGWTEYVVTDVTKTGILIVVKISDPDKETYLHPSRVKEIIS